MTLVVLLLIIFLIVMAGGACFCIWSERKDWNDGRCDRCGSPWVCFDVDSQGGRGYVCRNHESAHYGPWISWPGVDHV
jgi:hypothetical protein